VPFSELLTEPPAVPWHLSAGRCLLFAYGQLQPHINCPATVTHAWPDQVRGLLYDLGRYPAAVCVGAVAQAVYGYVMEIAESELIDQLDAFEGLADGLYRRIRTVTRAGFEVWIYEYARPIPQSAPGPIERWRDSP
jgi:gamma-glutamylcyclotransferase (GGCT)/AIG2-like uncharacterized protein YtfP